MPLTQTFTDTCRDWVTLTRGNSNPTFFKKEEEKTTLEMQRFGQSNLFPHFPSKVEWTDFDPVDFVVSIGLQNGVEIIIIKLGKIILILTKLIYFALYKLYM